MRVEQLFEQVIKSKWTTPPEDIFKSSFEKVIDKIKKATKPKTKEAAPEQGKK